MAQEARDLLSLGCWGESRPHPQNAPDTHWLCSLAHPHLNHLQLPGPRPHSPPCLCLVLTRTCQTCSLALRKLQKRTLAPSRPWPPHMLLGTTSTSRTFMVFMLNTSSFTGFSTLALSSAFSVSFSLFCRGSVAHSLGPKLGQRPEQGQAGAWAGGHGNPHLLPPP